MKRVFSIFFYPATYWLTQVPFRSPECASNITIFYVCFRVERFEEPLIEEFANLWKLFPESTEFFFPTVLVP
jgi:hypothetical protein